MDKRKILFVCLGNICRSPAAEEIARCIAREKGVSEAFLFDSAGLYSGHAGELPDKRMRVHAVKRGYTLSHKSRPVRESDFDNFDLIVAMDDNNFSALRRLSPSVESEKKIVRMMDFTCRYRVWDHVPDPYYEGAEGFELVLDLLEDACEGLIENELKK